MYTNPYDQPTYTGPAYPPLAPVASPLPHQRLWRRFRSARRRTRWGLGCLTLVLVLTVCTCTVANGAATTTKPSIVGSNASTLPAAPTKDATSVAPVATVTKQVTPTTSAATATPFPTPMPMATATPAPQPTKPPIPTQVPAPTQPPVHTGVNGNPWGYDFTSGNYITAPPANFCTSGYFNCIANFWNGKGYVDECVDGMYSKSGGIRGACSHHGGELQPLYSH